MQRKEMTIVLPEGLHLSSAGRLAERLSAFKSSIFIERDGELFDAKSVIKIMTAGLGWKKAAAFLCYGEDEADAMRAVEEFFAEEEKRRTNENNWN